MVDFFAGKSVLITGATGFVGKVLLEKLLRACPAIGTIYLLMRVGEKDGKAPADRLKALLTSRAFTFSSSSVPLPFEKVVAIAGDMTQPGLGLSPEDRKRLAADVQVVFHSAATVKFHGPLREFIVQNVLGTEAIMQLGEEMRRLEAIVYVSTAYANCNLIEVEERVYPLERPAQELVDEIMAEAEETDEKKKKPAPKVGDPELLGRPNSYTLSKAIAENLVLEKYAAHLPVTICRPSIVTHSYREPTEGWCDSMNGLAGTLLLGGLGIARTMKMDCHFKADIIPVDFVANSLIVTAWHTATTTFQPTAQTPSETTRQLVVHITSGVQNPVTWGQILDFSRLGALKAPSTRLVRPIARVNPVSARGGPLGKAGYHLTRLLSHHLFALLFDLVLLVTGHQRLMVKVTRKMHRAFDVLEHFTNHQWCFRYAAYGRIFGRLSGEEQALFQSNVGVIDWPAYCDALTLGSRRYLLNEDDSTIGEGLRRQRLLTAAYRALDGLIYLGGTALAVYLGGRLWQAW